MVKIKKGQKPEVKGAKGGVVFLPKERLMQKKSKKILDDDDEDIEIDIRDEEEEEGVDKEEVEAFIKQLGLNEIPEDVKLSRDKKTKKDKKKSMKGEKKLKPTEMIAKKDSVADQETSTTKLQKKKRKKKTNKGQTSAPIQHNEISSSSARSSFPLRSAFVKVQNDTLVKYHGKWHEHQFDADPETFEASSDSVISQRRDDGKRLFEKEVEVYETKYRGEDRDQTQWMKTVVSSGVLADKVAALALRIQEAPLHSLSSLDQLLAMSKKKGKREAILATDALRRLFLEELLPGDRKLRTFEQHLFDRTTLNRKDGEGNVHNLRLILWYFEAQLKSKFQDFVNILQTLSIDNIAAVKSKAITTMYELLVNKPEQEKRLLTMLVNKVGDPESKMATTAVHWLQKLVEIHQSMKTVVVREVEGLLYRPNISTKTQYYCVCFLNQLILSAEEADLATKLIIIYFTFFNACTKRRQNNQKMLSAILSGVNRAYNYSEIEDEKVNEQMDLIFKVVHQASFGPALQALMLLRQVLASRHTMTDRYYSALYKKLMDPSLRTSPQQAMFLNLLFKTLKADTNTKRIKAFIKRLLQVCNTQLPPFICGALFMMSVILKHRPSLNSFQQWNEDSDDEEHFHDIEPESDSEDEKSSSKEETNLKSDAKGKSKSKSSWVHKQNQRDSKDHYDPLARNPTYSGAENSALWELKKLSHHYHPSVSLFASKLLAGEVVEYTGNPLQDFTLIRFLDRYVYRNPKKQSERAKTSVLTSKLAKASTENQIIINSKNFVTLPSDTIPLDAQFFYKYFSQKEELTRKKKMLALEKNVKKKKKEGDVYDTDEETDEEEEAEKGDWQFDSDASSVDDEEFDTIMEEQMNLSDEDLDLEEEDDYIKEAGDETDSEAEDKGLDFAGEFSRKMSKKEKKKKRDQEAESESDIEDEMQETVAEDFNVKNDDFDEEGFNASDEGDDFDKDGGNDSKSLKMGSKKRRMEGAGGKKQRKKKMKQESGEDAELLGNADEFSAMIDEAASAKFDNMSMHALANKDNANLKQLKWEENRDKWIRGRDPKTIIRNKKRQQQSQRRPSQGPQKKPFQGPQKKNKGKVQRKRPGNKKGKKPKGKK